MISALAELPRDLSADVCIIGAGAAGITLARQLAKNSIDVIVCEAGGLEMSDRSQDVYKARTHGEPYYPLDAARLRYFGGSTNHWGGWCRPLDECDFKQKIDNVPTSWPIGKSDLDPYHGTASEILELGAFQDDEALQTEHLKRVCVRSSPPVRFAKKYHGELAGSDNVRVILNANLVSARSRDERVTSVTVRDYDSNTCDISARFFVIACGGIENSRLLLWLRETGGLPFAQNARLIGRFWMEHPVAPLGDVVITDPGRFKFDEHALDFFAPTYGSMRNAGTLNCRLSLKTTNYGVAREVIADLLCVAPAFGEWAARRLGKGLACVARLKAAWEQEPVFHNAVTLGEERDRFGIPRSVLHWTRSALDHYTVTKTAKAFARYCVDQNIGRVRLDDWLLSSEKRFPDVAEMAGHHHMGGTRMAETASGGVVDPDCLMFGTRNLYVAGSSVFPSAGHADPTFSIVQLSLRLADHLARKLPHAS